VDEALITLYTQSRVNYLIFAISRIHQDGNLADQSVHFCFCLQPKSCELIYVENQLLSWSFMGCMVHSAARSITS